MPQILKLAQLVDEYGVAKMQIRRGGVKTGFDPECTTCFEFVDELAFQQQLFTPPLDKPKTFF